MTLAFTYKHLLLSRRSAYATPGATGPPITKLQGEWTWLSLIEEVRSGMAVNYSVVACIVALLAGATTTAVVKGHFHLVRPDPRLVFREATGGGLMAACANLIPGGNDVLPVYGLPSGSPHAIAAYAAMVALILAVLRISPLFRRWADWENAEKISALRLLTDEVGSHRRSIKDAAAFDAAASDDDSKIHAAVGRAICCSEAFSRKVTASTAAPLIQ